MPESKQKFQITAPALVIVAAVLAGLAAVAWMSLAPRPAPPGPPVLTAEAKAYLGSLQLSDVNMQAAESYVNSRVVEITGNIRNNGSRDVKVVDVTCVFMDTAGQIIKRERVRIVGAKGDLLPGAAKPFRLAFDDIPDGWNQALPALVIAQIQFA